MNKKKLAIGVENYKEIIDKSYYYVDKTLLIKELLEKGSKVNLFTRPRRFGKTLMLSMIKVFFERELNEAGEEIDNRHYFRDMKIMSDVEKIASHMGRYPVISFSLKSARQPNFEMAYQVLTEQIAGEFRRHSYVLKMGIFTEDEIQKYQRLMAQKASAAEYFGFTPWEVKEMLLSYGLQDREQEVRKWYDGYLFGETAVYNPWSVLNYIDDALENRNIFPRPYWSNTSSNNIIKELVVNADMTVRREIEDLIAGKYIEKPIHEEVTYGDIHRSQDYLWNFLFFTGYLRKRGERQEQRVIYLQMEIPNQEVLSNRESGMGRPDILLKPYDNLLPVVIIELKNTDKFTMMEEQCRRGLKQIEEKHFEEELLTEGYKVIRRCGICFCKKNCMVKME